MKWKKEGDMLVKEFEFKDFMAAIIFINKVAKSAEKANHHPNMLIHSYNKVRITLSTHSANKVTEKDVRLSHIIDKI
jgi:4a-hydroxytetrahydrobiopterin dehydratase